MTSTFNTSHDPHTYKKLEFKGQSVRKREWKQTTGETDRRTLPIVLPSRLTQSVINKVRIKWQLNGL